MDIALDSGSDVDVQFEPKLLAALMAMLTTITASGLVIKFPSRNFILRSYLFDLSRRCSNTSS